MEKTSYSYLQIWKIAYPILLTLLIQNLIQVIDTAFLGHVGEVELGASAIAGVYYIAVFTIAFGFSTGAQILIGRRNGEKNFDEIGEIVIWGAVFLLILAALIFGFSYLFAGSLLDKVLHSSNILQGPIEYLDWRMWGVFFVAVNMMCRAFFIGITHTKVLTWNAVAMGLSNVFFDYMLIFGHWGFPAMGIAGAALASVISEAISTLFFIIYLFAAVDFKKYGFIVKIRENWLVIRQILNISSSLMLQYFLSLTTWMFFFFAIERMGETALAISNIVRSFYMIICIPVFALSSTANTLVSNTIGAGKQNEVLSLIWKIARSALGISAVFLLGLALFPKMMLGIYTSNPELIEGAIPSFYVILVVMMALSVGNVFFQSVSGTGNTKIALFIEIFTLIAYCLWMILTAYSWQAPLYICWMVELVYAVFMGIGGYWYMQWGNWKNKKI